MPSAYPVKHRRCLSGHAERRVWSRTQRAVASALRRFVRKWAVNRSSAVAVISDSDVSGVAPKGGTEGAFLGCRCSGRVAVACQPAGKKPPTSGLVLGLFVKSVLDGLTSGIAAGGKLLTPPADWPYGRRAALADPDGNRIELSESPVGRITGDYPE